MPMNGLIEISFTKYLFQQNKIHNDDAMKI